MEAERTLDSRTLIVGGAMLMVVGVMLRMVSGHAVDWWEVFYLLLAALDSILIPLGCALVAGGLVVKALRETVRTPD